MPEATRHQAPPAVPSEHQGAPGGGSCPTEPRAWSHPTERCGESCGGKAMARAQIEKCSQVWVLLTPVALLVQQGRNNPLLVQKLLLDCLIWWCWWSAQ